MTRFRKLLTWTLPGLGLVAGLLAARLGDGPVRVAGWVVTGAYGLVVLFGEFFLAWQMKRAAERDPSLVRNSDLGRRAVVCEAFVAGNGRSTGRVVLFGERWQACSKEGRRFAVGEPVVVAGREGLTLVVVPGDP
jgi:membrane protein implicated in regulation of membrane protease activity